MTDETPPVDSQSLSDSVDLVPESWRVHAPAHTGNVRLRSGRTETIPQFKNSELQAQGSIADCGSAWSDLPRQPKTYQYLHRYGAGAWGAMQIRSCRLKHYASSLLIVHVNVSHHQDCAGCAQHQRVAVTLQINSTLINSMNSGPRSI